MQNKSVPLNEGTLGMIGPMGGTSLITHRMLLVSNVGVEVSIKFSSESSDPF